MRRYEDYHEDKGKDTKISKIFQLSVTALSFLAFGGYLLSLIITAIRQNAMGNTGNGNVIVLSVSWFFVLGDRVTKLRIEADIFYIQKWHSHFRTCRVCKTIIVQKEIPLCTIRQRTIPKSRSCTKEWSCCQNLIQCTILTDDALNGSKSRNTRLTFATIDGYR